MGIKTGRFIGVFLILVIATVGASVLTVPLAYAQTNSTATGAQVDTYRAQLQKQLDDIEAQIQAQQKILDQQTTKRTSLERDIAILDAKIKSAKLAIKARDIQIQQLTASITDKQNKIYGLNSQLDAEKVSLAGILREKNQLDNTSVVITMLSSQNISEFFSDLDTFNSVNRSLQQSFQVISNTTQATQKEKDDLEAQLEQEAQLREVQALQEKQVEAQQAQENKILADTKGQEKAYQALIAANQKSAAQIRATLFSLNGSAAIPFGKALDYANAAAQKTGIRPAFLLGIIAEESNLGENVGTGSYLVDMHPTRDVPVFKAITASLGLDPGQMPVSKKAWYGWGGAMGPAQFIPSTWATYAGYVKPDYHYDSSQDRVGLLTGSSPPNPWDPKDAFMASALYLTDVGADAKTPAAEFKAAMCYLAGCKNASNKSLQFYGQQVASLANDFQSQINVINGG